MGTENNRGTHPLINLVTLVEKERIFATTWGSNGAANHGKSGTRAYLMLI
jgi:hypothetical protein